MSNILVNISLKQNIHKIWQVIPQIKALNLYITNIKMKLTYVEYVGKVSKEKILPNSKIAFKQLQEQLSQTHIFIYIPKFKEFQ